MVCRSVSLCLSLRKMMTVFSTLFRSRAQGAQDGRKERWRSAPLCQSTVAVGGPQEVGNKLNKDSEGMSVTLLTSSTRVFQALWTKLCDASPDWRKQRIPKCPSQLRVWIGVRRNIQTNVLWPNRRVDRLLGIPSYSLIVDKDNPQKHVLLCPNARPVKSTGESLQRLVSVHEVQRSVICLQQKSKSEQTKRFLIYPWKSLASLVKFSCCLLFCSCILDVLTKQHFVFPTQHSWHNDVLGVS